MSQFFGRFVAIFEEDVLHTEVEKQISMLITGSYRDAESREEALEIQHCEIEFVGCVPVFVIVAGNFTGKIFST